MNQKSLINNERIFEDTVCLVKELGNTEISGMNLREYLLFRGVSLWDVAAPFLACSVFPLILGQPEERLSLRKRAYDLMYKTGKSYLKYFRDNLNNFLHKRGIFLEGLGKSKAGSISILSLAFEPRHYQEIFAPLLQQQEGKEHFELVVIGSRYRAQQEKFKKQGLIFVEDFFHHVLAKENKQDVRIMAQKLKQARSILAGKLQDFYPYRRSLFMRELNSFFIWEFRSLIRQIIAAEKIISKVKPDIIVSGDDCDPRARVYFLMGKAKGIPSLLIQQGLTAANAVEWLFLSVDKAAVFGNYTKRLLVRLGVEEKKLIVTGQPRFDHLVRNDQKDAKERVVKAIRIPFGRKIILFTSQPNAPAAFFSETVRRKAIETIYRLAAELKDAVLVVKPHPDERSKFHHQLGKKLKQYNVFITQKRANTQDLIKACDILITFHSTTALEAILAGKPVIIVNFFGNDKLFYVESGAAIEACSQKEAQEKIKAVLCDENTQQELRVGRESFVNECIFNADGKATQRLINLMQEMAVTSK